MWLSFNKWAQGKEADWDNRPFNIYVQLQPGISMDAVNATVKDLFAGNVPSDFYKTMERNKPYIQLVPMSTRHLYSEFKEGKPSTGRITYVWLFGIIGIFVLLLACINLINLSTARSEKRSREVGVRKGRYPAFYLSSFKPVTVLKGIMYPGRFASMPRKVLVVIQFPVSVGLIIGTLVVYMQIRFGQNRPVGYDRNNLITLNINDPGYLGLSPIEALRAATINPAIFLGVEDKYGSIEKGKIADLVIFNYDPTNNIQNIDSIEAVIVNGKLLDQFALTNELFRVANSIKNKN